METAKSFITNLFGINGHAGTCEVCGNENDKCFEVRLNGEAHTFDCFECAIHALAPNCARCGCQIIGHGIEVNDIFYCCTHCARENDEYDVEEHAMQERSPA